MLFIRNGVRNLNRLQKARVDFADIAASVTSRIASGGRSVVGLQSVTGAITAAGNRVILGIQFGDFAVEMVGKTVFDGSVLGCNACIGAVLDRNTAVIIYIAVVSCHAAARR